MRFWSFYYDVRDAVCTGLRASVVAASLTAFYLIVTLYFSETGVGTTHLTSLGPAVLTTPFSQWWNIPGVALVTFLFAAYLSWLWEAMDYRLHPALELGLVGGGILGLILGALASYAAACTVPIGVCTPEFGLVGTAFSMFAGAILTGFVASLIAGIIFLLLAGVVWTCKWTLAACHS